MLAMPLPRSVECVMLLRVRVSLRNRNLDQGVLRASTCATWRMYLWRPAARSVAAPVRIFLLTQIVALAVLRPVRLRAPGNGRPHTTAGRSVLGYSYTGPYMHMLLSFNEAPRFATQTCTPAASR